MTRTLLLLLGTALGAVAPALAQTTITDAVQGPLRTSDTGDLVVEEGAVVEGGEGSAVVVDSDADVTVAGTVETEDTDNSNGVELQAGNSGNLLVTGSITNLENRALDNDDDDVDPDGRFAEGSGRTGILISGAGTFTGNVLSTAASGTTPASNISVEGNDSAAVRLSSVTRLDGDIVLDGNITLFGDNSQGLDLRGTVSGDVATNGAVTVQGGGSSAVRIAGDVDGGYSNAGTITNTGYRFLQRPPQAGVREDLDADDLLQGGSAVQINGSIAGGLFFRQVTTTFLNEDGTEGTRVVAVSSVTQAGGAPAILVDGQGTPISIGVVAEVTDLSAEGFDPALQFAFVNQGTLAATGVYDDVGATAFEVRDATLAGGIANTGTMAASAIRSGDNGEPDAAGLDGVARVIVLGPQAIADSINNGGTITATVAEDGQTVFADRADVIPPRFIEAVAIDIDAAAEVASLTNSGVISAVLTGRDGEAVVVRDASGTLRTVDNSGFISALGSNSDSVDVEPTSFNLVALDLRGNTVGVRITQTANALEGALPPRIDGDVLLGSGDDVVDIRAGTVLGALSFGEGSDTLSLRDGIYLGELSDPDGTLALTVSGSSSLTLLGGAPVAVADASFGAGSTFRPSLDGQNGTASTLVASGAVTFADGARVAPVIESFVGGGLSRFSIARGSELVLGGDVASLAGEFSPFLYDTSYGLDVATNTLFVDLSLRDAAALGLDEEQGALLPAAFGALGVNADLARAIINIDNEGDFNRAYNQLLPEFGAAARQFLLASTDGAVGAVSSHLASARRSQDRTGGAWLQEYGYFADRDLVGLSEQYRGQGFGFTGGLDTAWGPFHAVGLNLGFSSSEIEDVVGGDDPMDVQTFQAGLYAASEMGGLGLEGYLGGGLSSFDTNRVVAIGDFLSEASGDYSGWHTNGSLRAGYDVSLGGRFWARPVVAFDYLRLRENDYVETGDLGVGLSLDERTSETMATSALLNLGAEFNGRRTWIRPAVRVGYRHEFLDDIITSGTFAGLDTPFALTAGKFPRDAIILGLSVAAGSEYSSIGFDLDSDIRDGFVRHTGRIVVRLLF